MDTFASDLACVVRNLFPEENGGGGAKNKRKRNSIFAALSPSPARGLRNVPKSNGTDATAGTASTCSTKGLSVSESLLDERPDSEVKKNLFMDEEEEDSEFEDEEDDEYALPTSPSAIFQERFANVLSYYPANSDYLVIRDAIIDEEIHDDADSNSSHEVPITSLTMEQLNTIRVLVVTPIRQERMDEMGRLILGSKFGEQNQFSYGPGFWYTVLRSYAQFKTIFGTEKDVGTRFDLIFGFTRYLSMHTRWLTHHGRKWGGESMISGLALRWKHMLQYSAKELELDEEFSLPAVLCFLEEFQTTVESAEMYGDPPLRFDYT
ncbi:MAG: hypothetical protein SGARI_003830 [Bacillariaceae sp.]